MNLKKGVHGSRMISKQVNNDKEYFTNFYMNLFNILIMIDLNEDDNKKNIALIYNGRDIFIDEDSYFGKDYKDNSLFYNAMFGQEVTTPNNYVINRIDHFIQMNTDNRHKYFNVLSNIVYITQSTYNLLINLKTNIFESENLRNYDLLSEDIEYLSVLAQKSLIKYLKNKTRDKVYKIYDLFKDYILSLESVTDNEKIYYKFESTEILKYLPDLNINDKELNYYLVCNYNNLYKLVYIDNLVLIAIYVKCLTAFQLKHSEDSKVKYSLFNIIGLFNRDFMTLKDCITTGKELSLKQERILSSNYPTNGTDADLINNFPINILNMSYNTTYSIANSIVNLYRFFPDSLKYNDLAVYIPHLDNDNICKAIYDLSILSFDSELSIRNYQNMFINVYFSRQDYNKKYSFGRFIKFANADISSYYGEKTRYDNQPVGGYNKRGVVCEDVSFPTSIFKGRYQNINKGMYPNTRIQYTSSVWLRPLFNSELITSYTLLSHFTQLSRPISTNINSSGVTGLRKVATKRETLFEFLFNESNSSQYNKLINSEMPISEYDENIKIDNYNANKVSYQTSLGSVFLMRCYMICLLEYFSRQYDIKLIELTDKENKHFKEYFSLIISIDSNSLANIFNTNYYEMNNMQLDIKTKDHYNIYQFPEIMTINNNNLTYSNLNFRKRYDADLLASTFYLYFNNVFKVTHSMLEQICNIAKEDYISCPYL